MPARLPRLFDAGEASDHQQEAHRPNAHQREARTRRVSRIKVRHWVSISSTNGHEAAATVRDISAHGCNIRSEAAWLRIGAFISIRREEDSVMGIVRWVRDGSAGIEFLRPLLPGQEAWAALMDEAD